MITLIAAVAKNGVIGNGNAIPWHLPEDFKHFSSTTKGHIVIMGRKTWESLPPKFRPLPGRTNVVISQSDRDDEGALNFDCWASAYVYTKELAERDNQQIFVIGGAKIYDLVMRLGRADRLLISEVDMEPEGDTFFPEIGPEWVVSSRDQRDGFAIVEYVRA